MSKHETHKSSGHIQILWMLAIIFLLTQTIKAQNPPINYEDLMVQYGLVDIQAVDPTIMVDLKYASEDNFMGKDMYGSLRKAYALPHIAEKLKKANAILRLNSKDSLCLVIYDAARPKSVQEYMYSIVQGTPQSVYVAKPTKGGRHNFGVAVDLSIWNKSSEKEIDMGTPFDFFGESAHLGQEEKLLQKGLISKESIKNRRLLIDLMKKVGLRPYHREWWHYEEPMPISEVRRRFKLLDF